MVVTDRFHCNLTVFPTIVSVMSPTLYVIQALFLLLVIFVLMFLHLYFTLLFLYFGYILLFTCQTCWDKDVQPINQCGTQEAWFGDHFCSKARKNSSHFVTKLPRVSYQSCLHAHWGTSKQSGRSPKVVALFSATNFSSNIIELLQLHDTIQIKWNYAYIHYYIAIRSYLMK